MLPLATAASFGPFSTRPRGSLLQVWPLYVVYTQAFVPARQRSVASPATFRRTEAWVTSGHTDVRVAALVQLELEVRVRDHRLVAEQRQDGLLSRVLGGAVVVGNPRARVGHGVAINGDRQSAAGWADDHAPSHHPLVCAAPAAASAGKPRCADFVPPCALVRVLVCHSQLIVVAVATVVIAARVRATRAGENRLLKYSGFAKPAGGVGVQTGDRPGPGEERGTDSGARQTGSRPQVHGEEQR